jgi:hypothetical protein
MLGLGAGSPYPDGHTFTSRPPLLRRGQHVLAPAGRTLARVCEVHLPPPLARGPYIPSCVRRSNASGTCNSLAVQWPVCGKPGYRQPTRSAGRTFRRVRAAQTRTAPSPAWPCIGPCARSSPAATPRPAGRTFRRAYGAQTRAAPVTHWPCIGPCARSSSAGSSRSAGGTFLVFPPLKCGQHRPPPGRALARVREAYLPPPLAPRAVHFVVRTALKRERHL